MFNVISPQQRRPPRPNYHFVDKLPTALAPLRARAQWLCWDYRWNEKTQKWTKPPCDARTGIVCGATDPARWGTYEEAVATARRRGLAGVGFALDSDDGITGVDLDYCLTPETGKLSPLAAEIISYGETYAEISPSGTGIRLFARGKIGKALKDDSVGVELYGAGRYLTVTGNQVSGTPTSISAAPRTIAGLTDIVERARGDRKNAKAANAIVDFQTNFFQRVNAEALAHLDHWVPDLLPQAVKQGTGAWRVASADLGRSYEEALSIHPDGIQDFGPETSLTPIDLVMEYGGTADAALAALWLCDRMSIDPARIGWRDNAKKERFHWQHTEESQAAAGVGHNSRAAQEDPIPLLRDLPPALPFPTGSMGAIMEAATLAFHNETQAPIAICANAVLASATSAVQRLFDVKLPHGGRSPTSLFFASVARSGERKTAVDSRVLRPLREREGELREDYEREARSYRDRQEIWEAARKKTIASSKLSQSEKRNELADLGPAPTAPLKPILAVSDVTAEGTATLLETALSLGLFATEGGQFTGGHGMSSEAKLRTAAFFSRLWDDGSSDRVRAREEAKVLQGRRLSIHLQLQPEVALAFFGDAVLRDQGLLSRFLVAFPESRMGHRLYIREINPELKAAQMKDGAQIKELLRREPPTVGDRSLDAFPLSLTDEAEEVSIGFVEALEGNLAPGGELAPISGLANKLPEHAARLAAVITVIENPDATEIDAAAIHGGVELASHFASEALRLTIASREQTALREAETLWSWLDQKWRLESDFISVADLLWRGPNFVRDKGKAEQLVGALAAHGFLTPAGRQVIGGKPRQATWRLWARPPQPAS